MRCMACSPEGIVICTGGEDVKLKLWNATSGFCYVTMEKSHTAPITAVAFANFSVVLSASLEGTVRAHDLQRYRTFKTLTTPTPVSAWLSMAKLSPLVLLIRFMSMFGIFRLQNCWMFSPATPVLSAICRLATEECWHRRLGMGLSNVGICPTGMCQRRVCNTQPTCSVLRLGRREGSLHRDYWRAAEFLESIHAISYKLVCCNGITAADENVERDNLRL